MAFKEVESGNMIDLKKFLNQPLTGRLIGVKKVRTKNGESMVWSIIVSEGKMAGESVGVWGFTALNMGLEKASPGALVRITYTGRSEKRNNYGNFSHKAKVEVDDEAGIDKEIAASIGAADAGIDDAPPF